MEKGKTYEVVSQTEELNAKIFVNVARSIVLSTGIATVVAIHVIAKQNMDLIVQLMFVGMVGNLAKDIADMICNFREKAKLNNSNEQKLTRK